MPSARILCLRSSVGFASRSLSVTSSKPACLASSLRLADELGVPVDVQMQPRHLEKLARVLPRFPDVPVLAEVFRRKYAADEYEFYVQDSWRIAENLTVTAGLRYGLYAPPYEVNGQQVAPTVSMGELFAQRDTGAQSKNPFGAGE